MPGFKEHLRSGAGKFGHRGNFSPLLLRDKLLKGRGPAGRAVRQGTLAQAERLKQQGRRKNFK